MIIDAHTHIFDRSVGGAGENFPLWPGSRWGGGAPDLIPQMDEAGIAKVFLISYTPMDVIVHFRPEERERTLAVFQHYLTTDYFVRMWQQHPDRFAWFADSIDPRVPGYVERAAQDLDRGAAGLKLLPLFVDTEMGDPRWRPIFELLRERRKPCIVDLSWWYAYTPWFAPSVYQKFGSHQERGSYTRYVQGFKQLVADFPTVKVQLAHYGTPRLLDVDDSSRTLHYDRLDEPIDLMRAHPNLACDLGAYQHVIGEDDPYPYERALKIVEILVGALGAERVHWGTDWPYLGVQPYPNLIRAIREAPFLNDTDTDAVLGLNAQRFLEP